MIKGINKQILEVTNTESPYFERIVFFVKPQGGTVSESVLKAEAEKISRSCVKPPKTRRSLKERVRFLVCAALGIGAGCALTLMMHLLLQV